MRALHSPATLRFPAPDPHRLELDDRRLEVAASTIAVWPFTLTGSAKAIDAWLQLLDDDERNRANRFMQARHRDQYIVAHGVLRYLLGRYLGLAPASLRFGRGASGKPCLVGPHAGLAFNLTHSHGRALLAVGDRQLGVDLEMASANVEIMEIAERYFFGTELADIRSQSSGLQRRAFYRYWVAKEAVLKAEGVGLGFPLDRFAVAFDPGDASRASVHSKDTSQLSDEWWVRMLASEPDWPAAVATRGTDWTLRTCLIAD